MGYSNSYRIDFSIFLSAQAAVAAKSDGTATGETVGFVKEDNQRDTISLLLSCFATLVLCIYSAVHLNVPRKGRGKLRTLFTEFKWCLVGLFAPELILYTAWRQLASALQLQAEVKSAKSGENVADASDDKMMMTSPRNDNAQDEITFTTCHGFYGSMGGLVIDFCNTDNPRIRDLFAGAERLTLTAQGVALLAQCNHLPNIPLDDIKDKSKADSLAKLLVCTQAGWMIVQVITRTSAALPNTLLEVHTVAHVVCALLMYVVWWHKPRQITAPTVMKGGNILPLITYMFLASRMSGEEYPRKMGQFKNPTPKLKQLIYMDDACLEEVKNETEYSARCLEVASNPSLGLFVPIQVASISNREPSSPLPGDQVATEQRRLAAIAVATYPALRTRFTPWLDGQNSKLSRSHLEPYTAEFLQLCATDWPNPGLLRRTDSLVMGMVLWGASMAYGAIHVAAWNYFFPSETERLLWHLSSVWVTFCAAFWLLLNFLALAFPWINSIWNWYNDRKLGWAGTIVITLLVILCGTSYIVSRTYLVIEAFASIRMVPSGVYETPSWTAIFPHL